MVLGGTGSVLGGTDETGSHWEGTGETRRTLGGTWRDWWELGTPLWFPSSTLSQPQAPRGAAGMGGGGGVSPPARPQPQAGGSPPDWSYNGGSTPTPPVQPSKGRDTPKWSWVTSRGTNWTFFIPRLQNYLERT